MREKKEINIRIGEQVKRVREQAGWTQEQLAEQVDVSPQYVSDLERGVVGLSVATLKRLCEVLSISCDRILFPQREENDVTDLMERCARLPRAQCEIVSDIVNRYLAGIALAARQGE